MGRNVDGFNAETQRAQSKGNSATKMEERGRAATKVKWVK